MKRLQVTSPLRGLILKGFILALFVLGNSGEASGQNYKASISLSKQKIADVFFTKTLVLSFNGIKTQSDLDKIQSAASYYTNTYTINFINIDFTRQSVDCKFSFVNKVNLPMVYRLLVVTGVSQLFYNGIEVLDKEKFFFKENPIHE